MSTQFPVLFDRQDVFKSIYQARLQEFIELGRSAGLPDAQDDRERVALILVDYQHDFVDPRGTLYVPGAQEDVVRLLTWFYVNAHKISTIYASLDTHLPFQIFYSSWWQRPDTHEHPQPFTIITSEDVEQQRWEPLFEPEWSLYYVRALQQQAKKDLMIWPYHTMEGTAGHALVAPISEAIAWHSAARKTQPVYIVKGRNPRTEFYGIFGAEVPDPEDPISQLNITLLDAVMGHDKVYVAGEAKSHCVLESERQMIGYLKDQPDVLQRLYFLRDCTSSVQHPVIDFEALAEAELSMMAQQGVQIVSSRDRI